MSKRFIGALFLAAVLFSSPVFGAQNLAIATYQRAESTRPEPGVPITQEVAEASLVRLAGNTRPEANAANDRGPVAPEFPMEHMLLQLRRPPEHEQALENYLNEVQDTKSPNYHHWLTAQEIGQQYGLPAQDLDAITGWLKSHGFIINKLYPNGVVIDFSGIAAEVSEAFHTEIHHLDVKGERHVASVSDPQIPAALASAVVGVVSLNDFRPRPQYRSRPSYTYNNCSGTVAGGTCYGVVPADLATIYNLAPLFTGGTSGKGQTIVVAEDSDVYSPSDWDTFRSTYGLSAFPAGSFTQEHPGCADPGVAADEAESILDAEWASAAAPSAAIVVASCMGTGATSGVLLAVENVLSSGTPPDALSISYGEPESVIGATGNAFIESLYQQAAAEGVSVFVAAGDQGAADAENASTFESNGLSVSGYSSTPYNVAVGATDFGNEYAGSSSTYWSNTNGKYGGSALSYVPEIPWNDSCASGLIATFLGYSSTYGSGGLCNSSDASTYQLLDIFAGGGGPSGCATGSAVGGTCAGYAKPAWQSAPGNPNDGVRDLPNVSMFGADGVWGNSYVICDSDPADFGGGCLTGWGGASFGAPIMAGIQALVSQQTGSRQGNPNPVYYSLAAAEAGYGTSGSPCNSSLGNQAASSCIFYDVTEGDIGVPCIGSQNCYVPSGTYGVLSISNSAFQPAYLAAPGWDFATGIGTLNAYNLVMGFPTSIAVTLGYEPKALHFPKEIFLGSNGASSSDRFVTIVNPKGSKRRPGAAVTIKNFSASGDFGLDSAKTTCAQGGVLQPSQTCRIAVFFTPTSAGPLSARLAVSDNATNVLLIPLAGSGVQGKLVWTPHTIDFGKVTANTTSPPKTLTLVNPNPVPMEITSIIPPTIAFAEQGSTCGTSLPPKQSCQVAFTFTPPGKGKVRDTATIIDDAAGSPQTVNLTGLGE